MSITTDVNRLYVKQMGTCGYVFLEKQVFDDEDVDMICDLIVEKYHNLEVVYVDDAYVMYCNEEGRQACLHYLRKRESDLSELLDVYRRALKHVSNEENENTGR